MTKTDIFSGFLGAGKTTLIRKLISEGYKNEKLVLIENEFGEIAIDGGFLKDAGVEITEMNSGCICCTLVGDFTKALQKVIEEYAPDRIIIEPSGVGKLSDVAKAVEKVEGIVIGTKTTVVDAEKCKMYMRNFGEFFNDQVENADLVVLSRTDTADEQKTINATEMIRALNPDVALITTPWDKVSGAQILEAMESNGLHHEIEEMAKHHHHDHDDDEDETECCCHGHHHHDDDDDDDGECHCHEHHHHDGDEDEECRCHEHHHHDDDDDDDGECHCHEHHHHDGEDDGCDDHEHHHHHHHHHHADEVFSSWGRETAARFSEEGIKQKLTDLEDLEKYGLVLRAKGFVDSTDGDWIYFDYVPGETDIRRGAAAVTGRICVIGSNLKEDSLKELFNVG